MRWRSSHLPLLLVLLLLSLLTLTAAKSKSTTSQFRICSYNIQKFNKEKAKDYRLMNTLTRVVYRCDICLLQSVVDPDGSVIKALLKSLNSMESDERYDKFVYKSVSSKALGKSATDMKKEQVASVIGQHQYESEPQVFTRAPFAVHFQSKKTRVNEFVLVPLHSDPAQAVQEMNQLYDVFETVTKLWDNVNVMFLGDFHAGCAYMKKTDKKNIKLFANTTFSWLIGDKVDTTAREDTSCPFDRIVVHGREFLKEVVPYSAKVFNIGRELKIQRKKVREISDNLPVEVRLKSSALLLQATPLLFLLGGVQLLRSL
ncbi:deoxyribonuclease gamma-like isoform X3 [Solea solea]|uniref:deoxyribonuclease gamma-like isoform X3 n=1 Tax=Solea solea TaxID=90069 RepID=UPI00272A1F23|nr:deoxyribonuclease gamma-like isoform X3 [Solea solea]